MDTALVYFVAGCSVWAVGLFYFFIIRGASDLGAGARSALVILTVVIIPALGFTLWHQAQSPAKLEALGFTPHPSFKHSIGLAAGGGENPTWLYAIDGASEAEIAAFYRQPVNHRGWRLHGEDAGMLLFERDDARMHIQIGDGEVAFMHSSNGGQSP